MVLNLSVAISGFLRESLVVVKRWERKWGFVKVKFLRAEMIKRKPVWFTEREQKCTSVGCTLSSSLGVREGLSP